MIMFPTHFVHSCMKSINELNTYRIKNSMKEHEKEKFILAWYTLTHMIR
jgi:hypothetical protein